MKKLIVAFRQKQFVFLYWLLNRDYIELYHAANAQRILELSSTVSEQLYMSHLTREGFVHCDECPRRFGLRNIGGKYFCDKHVGQFVSKVA